MRLFKFLVRSVLAITLAGVAAKANAQSIDELYQAAKKEGALSLNGGGLAGLYEPWVREFEQRFPGIKVKVITCYPNDDDVTLYLFYTIVQKYGWEFMDKYMANNPQWVRGHLGTARAVASGQSAVTFDTMANVTLGLKKNNQPTNVAFSNVDPLPIWPQTTAIFKDAPHPNAAKLYITWFLAKEQQSRTGTWSTRLDVPPPSGLKPIFDYRLANNFRSFITNEKLA